MSYTTRGPEMFSKEFLWKDNAFMFEKQEMKQQMYLSPVDVTTPPSPMKKFGNYVPKILAGEADFLERENSHTGESGPAKLASTSQSASSSSFKNSALRIQPNPWIIGDKNVPLVLDIGNTSDSDYDTTKDSQHGQFNKYNFFPSSEMKDFHKSQRSPSVSHGRFTANYTKVDTTAEGICDNDSDRFIYPEDHSRASVLTSAVTNIASSSKFRTYSQQNQQGQDDDNAFIPDPDYDEEEQVAYFNSEDVDRGQEVGKPGHVTAKRPVKMYDGADLSGYLNDEDAEEQVVDNGLQSKARKTMAKKTKSESGNTKLSDKFSFFKQNPKMKNTRKLKGNQTPVVFNTVRNFSYADSKSANLKKVKLVHSASVSNNTHDDGESFLQANQHDSPYELFLRSRHGDISWEQAASRDSSEGVVDGSRAPLNHSKQDTVWKKLTLRLKDTVIKRLLVKGN